MSLENEDGRSPDTGSGNFDAVLKKRKISYSREFLLSLGKLDTCKKLPSGFDESLLCEFEDATQSMQDRPRIPGSLPLQGFRRNDYGSSPPTRGDSGNYSRGVYGRWESRSSGRSDRDSDSQSDWDSDPGRRYDHQFRRSWQTKEQDGLLGSGSFPRPSGYAAGISAPKVRANEHYQLSRSNEPYHPSRPYKAAPYSRRDTYSYNDETFGSMECNNEDRVEEERKRRASFELMRKEQQKALKEKQRSDLEKHKSNAVDELCEVLDARKQEKRLSPFRNKELEISAATPTLSNDLEKSSFASHSQATRPLVPPGFKNNILEKSSGLNSPSHHPLSKMPLDDDLNLVQNGINDDLERRSSQGISSVDGQPAEKTPLLDKEENLNLLRSLDLPIVKPGLVDQLPHNLSNLDSQGTLDTSEIVELNPDVLAVGDSNRNFSTSSLEKIFGSALSVDVNVPSSAGHHGNIPDETWSPSSVQSSKFARWFFEEDTNPLDGISSGKPNNLLSLIASADKNRYQVSDSEAADHFPSEFSSNTLEQSEKLNLELPTAVNGVCGQACINDKAETFPTVLTCEDLEQSMLTEYSAKDTSIQPHFNARSTAENTEELSKPVDDHASLDLLSLLQKGREQNNMTLNTSLDISLPDKSLVSQEHDMGTAANGRTVEENGKNTLIPGKSLTLETLFGSAFMKELQSVKAPVSVQRGSMGTAKADSPEPHGLPFPVTDNDVSSLAVDRIGLQGPKHDHMVLSSNRDQQIKLSKAENWLSFDGSCIATTSSKHQPAEVPKRIGGGLAEYQLPEENIVSVTDPLDDRMSTFMRTHNSVDNVNFSQNAPISIMDNLTAISTVIKDERAIVGSGSLPFTRGPCGNMEPGLPYSSVQMQVQQPSQQLRPPQMTQVRQLYNHLEPHVAHMNSQMEFLGPEPMFKHHSPASHEFPSSMIQHPLYHPNIGIAGFDVQLHHSTPHHMLMLGNCTPHVLPDFLKGPIFHHGNQATGFIQEMNQVQAVPLLAQQPSIGSRGLPLPAPDINSGSNPPEAFQGLIEMELQANSKHIHPLVPGLKQGVLGHVVDMGFHVDG